MNPLMKYFIDIKNFELPYDKDDYVDDWTCRECGQSNSEGDDYCISCGSSYYEQNP